MKARAALLAAIALGFLSALAVRQYIKQKDAEIYQGTPLDLVVAKQRLEKGKVITNSLLEKKRFSRRELDALKGQPITWNDRNLLIEKRLEREVPRGKPIVWEDVEAKRAIDTSLQARLGIGERAFTISVNRITGVGGMIRPGDRVDLYAVSKIRDPSAPGGVKVSVFPIIRSVEVLATGTRVKEIPGALSLRQRGKGSYNTLTLRLTSREVGLVCYTAQTGSIVAALRNRKDRDPASTEKEKVSYDVFDRIYEDASSAREKNLGIK